MSERFIVRRYNEGEESTEVVVYDLQQNDDAAFRDWDFDGPGNWMKSQEARFPTKNKESGVRAEYEIVTEESSQKVLVIRDVGCNYGRRTITNDAENVVERLLRSGLIKVGMRLFYYDSAGELDEIGFDSTGFRSFIFGGSRETSRS